MTLRDYLEETGQTIADFARRHDWSPFTVGKWARHERIPRPKQMARLQEVTGGSVSAADFYAPLGRQEASAA